MTAGGGVDVLAVMDSYSRVFQPNEGRDGVDMAAARELVAELIAADREYDEAREALRKLERDLSASGAAIDAAIDRVEAATGRRASALAAVEPQSTNGAPNEKA